MAFGDGRCYDYNTHKKFIALQLLFSLVCFFSSIEFGVECNFGEFEMSNEVSTKNEKRKREEGEGTESCKSVKMPEASEDIHEEDNNSDDEDEEDNNNEDNENLDLWQVRFCLVIFFPEKE